MHSEKIKGQFTTLILGLSFLSGLLYFAGRYRHGLPGVHGVAGALLAGLFYTLATIFFALVIKKNPNPVRGAGYAFFKSVFMVVMGTGLIAVCAYAISLHMWENLVTLDTVAQPTSAYRVWSPDGTSKIMPDLDLKEFYAQGDEASHLAASVAVRENHWNLKKLSAMLAEPLAGHNRVYWLRRHFTGHPLGLATIYSPVSWNPPMARVFGLFLTLCATLAAYWAGRQLGPDQGAPLLLAATFFFIPYLMWNSAFRVSSDILPCLSTFFAIGCFWAGQRDGAGGEARAMQRKFIVAGLLLALACFCTHTACLTVAAVVLLALAMPQSRNVKTIALLALPAVLTTCLGILLSAYVIGWEQHSIVNRLMNIFGHGTKLNMQGMSRISFLGRLPQDLGLPMCVFFAGFFVLSFWDAGKDELFSRLMELGAALTVIVPSVVIFWPQLRFMYSGWILIVVGFGWFSAWRRMTPAQRAWAAATLISFATSKFIFLRLVTS